MPTKWWFFKRSAFFNAFRLKKYAQWTQKYQKSLDIYAQ
nr:MAG TPA: hypothetical protein [Caudoviricetes sp.]